MAVPPRRVTRRRFGGRVGCGRKPRERPATALKKLGLLLRGPTATPAITRRRLTALATPVPALPAASGAPAQIEGADAAVILRRRGRSAGAEAPGHPRRPPP